MTRSLSAMLLILSCAAAAAAQPPEGSPAGQSIPSFQELRNDVRPGDTLYVVDAQGEETKGRLTNILDAAIMLDVDGTRRRFSIDSISQIDRTRRDSVKNGVLIGLATGAIAGYALGRAVAPVPTVLDNFARAKLIVRTTLLHARETAEVERDAPPVELALVEQPLGV